MRSATSSPPMFNLVFDILRSALLGMCEIVADCEEIKARQDGMEDAIRGYRCSNGFCNLQRRCSELTLEKCPAYSARIPRLFSDLPAKTKTDRCMQCDA